MRIVARVALLALAGSACDRASEPSTTGPTAVPAGPVASRLPSLTIVTAGRTPVFSRDTYVSAEYTLADTFGVARAQGTLEIRGRGNSTWGMPKKPYRLRLGAAAPLLGMPSDRHWALLANYSDKTLVRNDVAFELSRQLGFAWTPRSEFVEVTLNGSYDGVYQLTEHIRVDPDRVNVPELEVEDTAASVITGGYLIEVDERRGEPFCVESERTDMAFCLKSPEDLLEPEWAKQRAYIEDYIRRTDDAIFGPNFADPAEGYAAFIDVPSAIDYFLLNEVFKNVDGNLRLSTYLFKPRGGKLTFGPVWDYDIAMGNVNYDGADLVAGWHSKRAAWYDRMFQDPAFDAAVKARWRQLRASRTLENLIAYSTMRTTFLSNVQSRNFQRWPILGTWVWPNRVVTGSYRAEVLAMHDWLGSRIRWMDSQLGS